MKIFRFFYRLVLELIRLATLILRLLDEIKEFLNLAFNYLQAKTTNASTVLYSQIQTQGEDLGFCAN